VLTCVERYRKVRIFGAVNWQYKLLRRNAQIFCYQCTCIQNNRAWLLDLSVIRKEKVTEKRHLIFIIHSVRSFLLHVL